MVPPSRRFDAEHILGRLRTAYLGWLRGLALGMLVLGGITYLGLRLAGRSNGVAALHGKTSREMFQGLWPPVPAETCII